MATGVDRQNKPDIYKSEQQIQNWSFDEMFNVLATMQLVYNPATGNADRFVQTDAAYILYDPDDSTPSYIGINSDVNAATTDATWLIYRFTYTGSNVTSIKRKVGAWNSRATLLP